MMEWQARSNKPSWPLSCFLYRGMSLRLTVFTASETAHMFAPSERAAGRKEVDAASAALEQLACSGVLVCQKVNGELRCIND